MFKNKIVLFISEYSKENILFAEELCENKKSVAVFWENEDLKESKNNYFDMLDISNEISDNFFIISEKKSDDFIMIISDIILKSGYDLVITKGMTTNIWPISLVKNYFSINHVPFLAILENLKNIEKFDLTCLRPFDYIFGMGPSCFIEEFEEKTSIIFQREVGLYKNIQSTMKDSVLFLCNKNNIEKLSNHPRLNSDKISFIDPRVCPDEDLVILLNLAEIIIDESGYEEFRLILSKMGKKTFSMKEFLERNHNFLFEEEKDFVSILKRKKVFFNYLKKEMESKLKKIDDSLKIEGSTISIGD